MPKLKRLKTFDDVMIALGGSSAVAKMFDLSPAAVSAWRQYGERIPAKWYPAMEHELAERGYFAHRSLWRFAPIRKDAA